jgi:hypothetical protein
MPLIRNNTKNAYTAKVISVMDFPDTKSLSLLLVCKTENGRVIADKTVGMNISEDHELAQGLYDGVITEIGFLATGFSPEPVKGDESRPIYALVGLVKSSLEQILGGRFETGVVVTDETELKRKANMATRALAWIRAGLAEARGE